jgi:hypothetical protein
MILVRYPLPSVRATTSIDMISDGNDNAISNVHTNKNKLIDDMDVEAYEPVSPEVRKRLAKLKELNDAYNVSNDDFEVETQPSSKKSSRKSKQINRAVFQSQKIKVKKGSKPTQLNYTVEIVLATWNEETDYGKSFRAMNVEDKLAEAKRLNDGATKGLDGVIKNICWM